MGTAQGKSAGKLLRPKEHTTDEAAAKLGITAAQVRRIVKIRGYEPSRIEEWHHGRSSGTKFFWWGRTIATIRRTKEYGRIVQGVAKRRQKLDELLAKAARKEAERRLADQALRADVFRLSLDEHVRLALECLHAANRAAKHADHTHEQSMIYAAKDTFLSAMIRANLATVETFAIEQASREQVCTCCGREWVGDGYCYACDQDSGMPASRSRRWYLVDCGSGYRFHQPNLAADVAARAIRIEPHDPTQEPRSIPTVHLGKERPLDVAMQLTVVRSAAERLGNVYLGGLQQPADGSDPA